MSLDYKVFSGLCPDERCKTKLYYAAHKTTVECPNCGQRHSQNDLLRTQEVTDNDEAIAQVLKSIVWDVKLPKKGSDTVKVHGLSNYHCKLLSPLFTQYGMDKAGDPRLLSELGHGETADCGRLLCSRAFLISPEHIDITGYGRDLSGSVQYLQGLLDIINQYNDGQELLIPIHADGDGHCLVHALSRATTGREIFWHALRDNLVSHLEKNLKTYQNLFKDFHDASDWTTIIAEADPYHVSPEGFHVGLGNIHIFALSNVLKRPIVLLDSMKGIKNVADYTGIFVPAMIDPAECRNHLPLCVAWSGAGHNHFVPLVGVAGKPLPRIAPALIPNIWGVDRDKAMQYLNFNDDGSLTVAGGKPLQRGYLLRLVSAIEKVFLQRHAVSAELVADMHLYIFQPAGFVGLHPDVAIHRTREAVSKGQLFRCLLCNALSQVKVDEEALQPGGYLFELMLESNGSARTDKIYYFPNEELQCKYNPQTKSLVPYQFPCSWCKNRGVRRVDNLGHTHYANADPTSTPADLPGSCCGYKHFWDGREYENIPKQFTITLTIEEKLIDEQIIWFYGDSDPNLNSDSAAVARHVAVEHFGQDHIKLDYIITKIRDVIRWNLEDFDLSDDQNSESELSGYSEKDRAVTMGNGKAILTTGGNGLKFKSKQTSKSCRLGDDVPGTSKHPLMKRDVDGTMKPPSSKTASNCSSSTVDQGQETPDTSTRPTPGTGVPNVMSDLKAKCDLEDKDDRMLRIRVSTSDGRQETMLVSPGLDYNGFLKRIQKEFNIPPSRQVLKRGFPPRPITPDPKKESLGLRHGDRVTVEIRSEEPVPKTESMKSAAVVDRRTSLLEKSLRTMGKDRRVGNLKSLVDLIPLTQPMRNAEASESRASAHLDAALKAVASMAQITGKTTVWDYAVTHPELFLPGGVFYDQFRRDIGLIHGRHCMLPLIPGRVFHFNGDADRIELCLEPTGHFAIGPGIAEIISQVQKTPPVEERDMAGGSVPTEVPLPSSAKAKNQSALRISTAEETRESNPQPYCGDGKDEDTANSPDGSQKAKVVQSETGQDDPTTAPTFSLSRTGNAELKGPPTAEKAIPRNVERESKVGPGFSTVGAQPTSIGEEEAARSRQMLMEVLKTKKSK